MDQAAPSVVRCSRCKIIVATRNSWPCWWCEGPLCYGCWDVLGHCGHKEAEAVNKQMRAGAVLRAALAPAQTADGLVN